MKDYEYLKDLTSDVAFKAYGKDLNEVFINAAKAISSIMCDIKKVGSDKQIMIEVTAKNQKDLLYNWLQNIVAEVDIEGMFFSEFKILELTDTSLKAEVLGEDIDQSKQETVVKAVTNYLFNLEKIVDKENNEIFVATACVDI